MRSIDFQGASIPSLGNQNRAFYGSLNGNGFTISNFRISSGTSRVGLIGYMEGGFVKNLNVVGDVQGITNIGGVIGLASSVFIENVRYTGKVYGSGNNTGGIVGLQRGGSILRASANVGVVGVTSTVGGVVGRIDTYAVGDRLYATGTVYSDGTSSGGVAGRIDSSGQVTNAYFMGNVAGSDKVGGLVGNIANSSGNEKINFGWVMANLNAGNGATEVGFVIGSNNTSASSQATLFYDTVSSSTRAVNSTGSPLQTSQFKDDWIFKRVGWEFGRVWIYDSSLPYPILADVP